MVVTIHQCWSTLDQRSITRSCSVGAYYDSYANAGEEVLRPTKVPLGSGQDYLSNFSKGF